MKIFIKFQKTQVFLFAQYFTRSLYGDVFTQLTRSNYYSRNNKSHLTPHIYKHFIIALHNVCCRQF